MSYFRSATYVLNLSWQIIACIHFPNTKKKTKRLQFHRIVWGCIVLNEPNWAVPSITHGHQKNYVIFYFFLFQKCEIVTHLSVLFVKIAFTFLCIWSLDCVENQLKIGARRDERNFGVTLTTTILEAYLTFFLRPITEAGISYLWKISRKIC